MTNDDRILNILGELTTNVSTILQEQQAQRIDIRSLQKDVSALKDSMDNVKDGINNMVTKDDLEKVKIELKDNIEAAKTELKDHIETAKIEVKAEISKPLKNHTIRITNLEDHSGISDPTKH